MDHWLVKLLKSETIYPQAISTLRATTDGSRLNVFIYPTVRLDLLLD